VNKQVSRVALFSLLLLAALIVATTYWQTWASGGLASRQDNEIQRVAQFQIQRGRIYAANGRTLLAGNTRRKVAGQTLYFRTYPAHGFAAQVIGYSTQSRSRAGLEREENSYLTASNKNLGTIFDRIGDKIRGSTIKGNDIVLTLRLKPQNVAQNLLRGKCGAAVALNPKTGAIYAMASSPTFDPSLIEKPAGYAKILHSPNACPGSSSALLNRATQGLYAPGSTFKTVTAAAALDDGVYTPSSTFYDPGYCTEYGKQVKNALDQNAPESFGNVDFVTAFEHSINAVFCQIGMKLGAKRILAEAKKFGFYSVPPLETPSDARSASGLYNGTNLFEPKNDSQVDPGRLAFGQERMLVTPLQMALVAAAIAHGGTIERPTLIKEIRAPNGHALVKLHPHKLSQATKPETAAAIRDMMVKVVQSGTGTNAQIPGVTVAGKTGTAETGKDNVYTAWFIFFAPAENPTVAGAVVLENQLNGFGGAVAAPIAKAIMQAILPATSNQNS
jgi:peptidoglycan glycosyltransferase